MTDRERLEMLLKGEKPDRRPILSWPCSDQAPSGIIVRSPKQPMIGDAESLILAEIVNPFGIAIEQGLDLNAIFKDDPSKGEQELDRITASVRASILNVIQRKADGILYRLHGACDKWCTPMQYGGYYLERDRELLEVAKALAFNVLFVVGDEDVYFDFVSDLPAHAFGWDSYSTGTASEQMRAIREGLLLAADDGADVLLASTRSSIAKELEKPKVHA